MHEEVRLNDNANSEARHIENHRIVPMTSGPNLNAFAEASQDEYVLSLKDVLDVLRWRLWLIALVTVVLTGAGLAYDLQKTPIYQASVKILVGKDNSEANSVSGNLAGDVEGLQDITKTMAKAVNTRPVAENAIEKLGLGMDSEDLLKNMSVNQDSVTQFIDVSVRDESPERAEQIANAVGDVFSGRVQNISPAANGVTAMVWEPASTPTAPISPKLVRDGAVFFGLGIMLGVGLAFLLEQLNAPWRSPEEVEEASGVPSLGAIPTFELSKNKKGGN